MASDAERLIRLSIEKIAKSRVSKVSTPLHKTLMISQVLKKARYMFMEETIRMVYHLPEVDMNPTPTSLEHLRYKQELEKERLQESGCYDEDNITSLTAELASLTSTELLDKEEEEDEWTSFDNIEEFLLNPCSNYSKDNGKERYGQGSDLGGHGTKRALAVSEWETEQAILSILPKRPKQEDSVDDDIMDLDTEFSQWLDREAAEMDLTEIMDNNITNGELPMDIDTLAA